MQMLGDIILVLSALINAGPQSSVDYQKDIKPILRERCYACHGALKQESGLRLDTIALMKKGGRYLQLPQYQSANHRTMANFYLTLL
ncbi:MAG: hypothetical protein EBT02_15500, partial [Planctomycetia bacterium]|nr:hypothetical protein [Planctomycetia bacterium]